MFDLNEINESYLANLKYERGGKYYGWPMAAILSEIFDLQDVVGGSSLISLLETLNYRFISNSYSEIRFSDFSILILKWNLKDGFFKSKVFSFEECDLDKFDWPF